MKKRILFCLAVLAISLIPATAFASGTASSSCYPAVECDGTDDAYGSPVACKKKIDYIAGTSGPPKIADCNAAGYAGSPNRFSCTSGCYTAAVAGPAAPPSCPTVKLSSGLFAAVLNIIDDGTPIRKLFDCANPAALLPYWTATPNSISYGAATATGTVAISGTAITGTGTKFLSQLTIGDAITASGQTLVIASVPSDTSATTTVAASPAIAAGATMSIQKPFNVGIGTTTPSGLLHVRGANLFTLFEGTANNQITDMTFRLPGTGDTYLEKGGAATAYPGYFNIVNIANAPITFWTNAFEKMRIDQNGNVGIGTTTPATTLDVVGQINASGFVSSGYTGAMATLTAAAGMYDTTISVNSTVPFPNSGTVVIDGEAMNYAGKNVAQTQFTFVTRGVPALGIPTAKATHSIGAKVYLFTDFQFSALYPEGNALFTGLMWSGGVLTGPVFATSELISSPAINPAVSGGLLINAQNGGGETINVWDNGQYGGLTVNSCGDGAGSDGYGGSLDPSASCNSIKSSGGIRVKSQTGGILTFTNGIALAVYPLQDNWPGQAGMQYDNSNYSIGGGATGPTFTVQSDGTIDSKSPSSGGIITAVNTNPGVETLTSSNHLLVNGNMITVSSSGTLPAPLVNYRSYYVKKVSSTDFELSLSPALTPIINLTSAGTGTRKWTMGSSIKPTGDAIFTGNLGAGSIYSSGDIGTSGDINGDLSNTTIKVKDVYAQNDVTAIGNVAANSTTGWVTGAAGMFSFILATDVYATTLHGNCSWWGGGCSDFAEKYKSSELTEAGDILEIDPNNGSMRKSSQARSAGLVGVVSTSAGVILGVDGQALVGGDTSANITKDTTVMGLAGKVPTKVSAENGAIKIGDLITSSSVPGVGMKADDGDPTVGIALEAFNGTGVAKINVLISRNNGASELVKGLKSQIEDLTAKYAELEKRVSALE